MYGDPMAYQPDAFSLGAPDLTPRIHKKPLYASLFDRMNGAQDPNAQYQMGDADKSQSFRHGLLQFAAAMATPNGGNFAQSLSRGLLAGQGSMRDEQRQFGNDAYRNSIMKRTQDEMAANTQLEQMKGQILGPDGKIDEGKFPQYAVHDPAGAKSLRDALQPREEWTPGTMGDPDHPGNVMDVLHDKYGHYRTPDGQPLFGAQAAPQGAPMPQGGAGAQMPMQAPPGLAGAVMQQESGGNPFAVSPKGSRRS